MAREKQFRVAIGSDEAGYQYKERIKEDLLADPRVSAVFDVGIQDGESSDYPDIAFHAAIRIQKGLSDRAVLVCGTGLGVAISANKVKGIRAVTASDPYSIERSVLSNDAQVLCLGQRVIGIELARHLVTSWLSFEFDPLSNSAKKVNKIKSFETAPENNL
jgi:ribose 5-phosphate isomerase B